MFVSFVFMSYSPSGAFHFLEITKLAGLLRESFGRVIIVTIPQRDRLLSVIMTCP
jgi:hypothetical protein